MTLNLGQKETDESKYPNGDWLMPWPIIRQALKSAQKDRNSQVKIFKSMFGSFFDLIFESF